ncbi:tRNA-His guanylyltransferase [Puccinia graminis f. sp. tritici]|uniref:tRNA(His) guanylyltransferase n=1 Tax=Puccinia graminis f. sp. tritici TaxID=56615 RepID=A0A5B0MH55_PUCGR|nr:tRNA-His guanylyltransferase [Puccinia graminis f. sp. tritici]
MANSRFGYVRQAELDDRLLPNTFLVIRLDGKGFTKFSQAHGFTKPNDIKALNLMNAAAIQVLESDLGRGYLGSKSEKKSKKGKQKSSTGIVLAYGQSDEFSFAFGRNCQAYNRRSR